YRIFSNKIGGKDFAKGRNMMKNSALDWDFEAARASAPHALIMVGFIVAFSIWFGFAWGIAGWILFAAAMIGAAYILAGSLKNRELSNLPAMTGLLMSYA